MKVKDPRMKNWALLDPLQVFAKKNNFFLIKLAKRMIN